MIVLLSSCLNGLVQAQVSKNNDINSSTGKVILYDTVYVNVPIKFIREANVKLLERVYLIRINKQQDSIINLNNNYINNQKTTINDFGLRIIKVTDAYSKATVSLEKQKKVNTKLKVITITSVLLSLIVMLVR